MRIAYLQHVPNEGPGQIETWAGARGYSLQGHRLDRGDAPPTPEAADALVVLGGPMGVHDEADFAWLKPEKQAIGSWLRAGKPVLGICLGAQLIAHVLGAAVTRNPHREIGWFPLRRLPQAGTTVLDGVLPAQMEVLHWHGDTFAIPAGAIPIASSAACANQGFVYRERVVGLQFHLEVDEPTARAFIDYGAEDLKPGPWVQTAEEILSRPERFEQLRPRLYALLDAWIGA